ncbi:LLM class flavin-dependent oxidoreductase [Paraburkholderia unamae]|uniref:Alkanesulfonate monooxygenase SsuD/methylene tetrahydromethanopterin reductase-like flavin-dependent oxidoreductase (Luciferase family) n=1 Tax=Paraburkholderia unamae TaxID=219649 RepID=A0ABX5KU91_9BURK|nr:LLM class flavin-dependent oxidoreductase [Paraburkholderia unamae]PVX85546.1 alkanesulfonate monooxygenase SsuD/methylene tetrahydromethanopterin reductase-like flavin-dependent oxidoreductase (luciferase family) [Paraburkholderia unamae]RAR55245.1 alkanesulfonate monooxygenase SsuD/methylene tetrahydromethanopterin reductase-like flavin-dependent oxidoreductase (luciferase family) [Paraburkholderia unamae]CAG9268073.1 Nitrilotriacetate monooxygenase component A [Paraburkholderia unamae]
MSIDRKLILFVNALVTGHHEAAWRLPGAQPGRLRDIAYYQEIAQIAERGQFDAMFVADFFVFYPGVQHSPRWELDAVTLMAGVAATTSHLGLIATGSVTFSSPEEIARTFSTLDHVSNGRAAWNIVTTGEPAASANYGQTKPVPHAQRYARGAQTVEEVHALWRAGEHGNARIPAPVQGRPLLVQAGSSPDGRDFAARYADVVFTAQNTLEAAREFRTDIRERARSNGRDPDSIKVIPGFSPSIGTTADEALRRKRELDALIAPEASLAWLAGFGIDLSGVALDAPLPAELGDIEKFEGIRSRFSVIAGVIERARPQTVRELLALLAGSRGHVAVSGTPADIAAHIEAWFRGEAADGFMLMPHVLTEDLETFVDEVVPLLARAGILRDPSAGIGQSQTLRERLGMNESTIDDQHEAG